MKKLILALIILVITTSVHATSREHEVESAKSNQQSNANWNTNFNKQWQSQNQKQSQNSIAVGIGKGGTATAVNTNTNTSSVTGFNGNGGSSVAGSSSQTGEITFNQNQVKQTPFAYSPGLANSYSQENCANSASLGVSAGFGAIGGGMPVDNDGCNRRRDAQMWAAFGQNRIACERMAQSDENAEAMKKAGITCAQLTTVSVSIEPKLNQSILNTRARWDAIEAKRNSIFNR